MSIVSLKRADALESVLSAPGLTGPSPAILEAAISCCEDLSTCGESRRALGLCEAARKLALKQGEELQLRLVTQTLRALFLEHRERECLACARDALERFGSAPTASRDDLILVRIYEAACLWRLNRIQESLDRLTNIRRELLSRPDSKIHAFCALHISSAHIGRGDWTQARLFAMEALVAARRSGADFDAALALGNLCIAERGKCRWHSSADAGAEALSYFEGSGHAFHAHHVRRSLAITLWKMGRLGEALAAVDAAFADAQARGSRAQGHYASLLKALLFIHVGRFHEGEVILKEEFEVTGEPAESRPVLLSAEYLGDVFLEQGQAAKALEHYDSVLPHALALVPRGDIVAELRRRRAECYLLLGDPARGHAEALEAITHTRELGDRYEEAATYRIAALAAAALGRPDEAKKHFTQGFAYYDDIETPYEWGKLWMSYGDWLCGEQSAHYRDLSGAHEAYRAAEQHFEQMGAEHKLTEARARIAKLAEQMKAEGEALSGSALKARPRRRPRADRELQQRAQWAFETFGLVTRHRPLLDMLEQVSRVAASDLPVLVLGESGTGKELVARGVHFVSGRTGRFVEVNCSAVPASIMESEFFGSSHGSYTGSTRDRTGLLEDAHLGSFFLDEIGEMSLDLQSKLLRFLETGRVRRIGETDGRQVDVRLIAATNRAHDKLKTGSGFREDLYYRLAHAVIEMPPLRERGDDVELLLDHFLDKFCDEARKPVALSPAAREKLLACTWPGNVRQLRALIHRFVLQSPAGHVVSPREIPADDAAAAPRNFLEEMEGQEKRRIQEALERAHFVKADAARFLRMSRTTLIGKMKRYGITA